MSTEKTKRVYPPPAPASKNTPPKPCGTDKYPDRFQHSIKHYPGGNHRTGK